MRLIYLSSLSFIFLLQSCFVADSIFEEPQTVLDPMEFVVKDSISAYVKRMKSEDEVYLNYGFEPLKVVVPKSIAEQKSWKSKLGDPTFDQVEAAQQFHYYDSLVKKNNLKRKITQVHTFSLRGDDRKVSNLMKVNFVLSEDFSVVDIIPIYEIDLTNDEEKVFANYYYESPIIAGYTYEESKKLSYDFYQYFENYLNQLGTSFEKSKFVKHMVTVFGYTMKDRAFNVQNVCESLTRNYIVAEFSDTIGYQSTNFSSVYEIKADEKLIGYYLLHQFSYNGDLDTDSMTVYVRFTPYYEVDKLYETDQDYEPFIAEE
ncbi:hypothetical protein DNU06_01755 [Putridiphycobacter roseus]|uniref:Lipoprotein n=1 Tax=Putridiphycobacter roseus TaxID=2219161 RepID=A0A2W1N5Z3_9FLAO|nr:hypothetical protein [Putridiphycobacter roseus]PZE18581.1 hypothetical protein DNU06_01755 [Putridiphycobacter roseus]